MEANSSITAVPITRSAYEPYGSLIAAGDDLPFRFANMRTAKRFDFLADIVNLRQNAKINMCVFSCSPLSSTPLELKLLEKHQHSTQVFIPMTNDARYLVVVCLGEDEPDIGTLRVFEAGNGQGISYKPGVWHYPMTAIGNAIDFACIVCEDGTGEDCQIHKLHVEVQIFPAE